MVPSPSAGLCARAVTGALLADPAVIWSKPTLLPGPLSYALTAKVTFEEQNVQLRLSEMCNPALIKVLFRNSYLVFQMLD